MTDEAAVVETPEIVVLNEADLDSKALYAAMGFNDDEATVLAQAKGPDGFRLYWRPVEDAVNAMKGDPERYPERMPFELATKIFS